MLPPRRIYNLENSMNTKLIRVRVSSPSYRNSLLASGYTLLYNEDTKECELEIATSEGQIVTLNVPRTKADEFVINIEGVDCEVPQSAQFRMDTVGPSTTK